MNRGRHELPRQDQGPAARPLARGRCRLPFDEGRHRPATIEPHRARWAGLRRHARRRWPHALARGAIRRIISEAAPSELGGDYADTRRRRGRRGRPGPQLPLIGRLAGRAPAAHCWWAVRAGPAGLMAAGVLAMNAGTAAARRWWPAGQAQTQSQRLAKSVSQALVGRRGFRRGAGQLQRAGAQRARLQPATATCRRCRRRCSPQLVRR
jgi:hypothetical protein